MSFDTTQGVYVIPVKNALKVCVDKTTYIIPMTKDEFAYFGWEIMKAWRESDDTIGPEDFEIHQKIRQDK